MTKGQYKRRWMILCNDTLLCFESPFSLEVSKGILPLKDVSLVETQISANKCTAYKIFFGTERESWSIRWDEDEPIYLRHMWERKIVRCFPKKARVIKV
jgi:hypothetical protein